MNDPSILAGLAANPATPLPVLLRLADGAAAHGLLDRGQVPPPVARLLAGHPDPEVRRRLAAHPSTEDDVRCGLAGDAEPAVRAEVAAWPLPEEISRLLAADGVPAVRAATGRNRHIPPAVRAVLSGDGDPEVRRCAASQALPPQALHRLLGDDDRAVRRTALMTASVHGRQIPARLAVRFQDDPVPYYREVAVELVELTPQLLDLHRALPEALARNPSLPVERMWACLDDAALRVPLAANPRLPEPLVEALVATGDPEVHRELMRHADLPDRLRRRLLAADEDEEPLPAVTSLRPEHAGLGERLSYLSHPNLAFRRTLAMFPDDLPVDAVHQLAEDPDFSTRLLICERRTDVPAAALIAVIDGWHGHSRDDLLRHPALPAGAVAGYATAESPRHRAAVASRPDLPAALVMRLLDDEAVQVRQAAAANPNLPQDRLHQLLTDPQLGRSAAANPALPAGTIERLFPST